MEDQARVLAERIARRVGASPASSESRTTDIGAELAAMRATLNELQNRLAQIESKVTVAPRVHSPWHPSLERFGVEEATVSELVDFFQNEKQCSLEPGGKPCDHCAMCSSRGF
ncbi:MAG TPA: hypothetical protein VJ875_19845 [Pyrinomonadaceae bacterium]|nr:hypothetical protein [Pyrinomonadaceae bacterium]